jgi:phage baseplate assembly protein W
MADPMGTDLLVTPFFAAQDSSTLDLSLRVRAPYGQLAAGATEALDLHVVTGRENLAQALVLRLLTPVGSLAGLGHAAYGSRLAELIGRRKDAAARNLARVFVLEAVAAEPRVRSTAVSLDFHPDQETPDSLVFTLVVAPVDGSDPVAVTATVGL